jgi:hypothetical protein
VAGAAGLLLALARRHGRRPAPGEIREALVRAATPLGPAPNPETGHGRLDIAASLRFLQSRLTQLEQNPPPVVRRVSESPTTTSQPTPGPGTTSGE